MGVEGGEERSDLPFIPESWLCQDEGSKQEAVLASARIAVKLTSQLRKMISGGQLIVAPGVYDGLSALLGKRSGFKVLYASGGAISRSAGFPDIGLLSLTEVLHTMMQIVNATPLPVIADADTGFGNAINVWRTVREFERIGVAGLHLEDQTFPKRCGHLKDKCIISAAEMCQKINVARETFTGS